MKKIFIATALLLSASPAFAGTVIVVGCNCSYYSDYIQKNILAVGTRTNPSADELLDCVIKDGKIISGCEAAKMNAQFNCEESARSFSGAVRASVQLHEDACFGQITKD